MPLNPDFPTNPYEILDPLIRWFPGDNQPSNDFYPNLLPPLVHKIREGVATWRKNNYEGASQTSKALLDYWFKKEHVNLQSDGSVIRFQYYFAQREAVESCIWLYEIEKSHDPFSLLKYDSSKMLTPSMFEENWTRYVMKLATGAGKTKVMSLLVAWSYFHKKYELDSELSTNFLITAPNIIVLDRLRLDFDGLKIFFSDPIIPEDNYAGFNWRS
ncbi:TPA: type III restriction endonuclease subunit R, partial [Legionella pneumophila]|nr:type III restriction endonuclease subunit R [Legionella pneumophila]